ncbi:uncharacterized protein LOC144938176 isoform X3 [Lampetra fluviatilis]
MEEEKRRRKVEAGKAKLAEFRQRKAKGDVAHPEKEKKKGKRTPLHQHDLSTEEHALTAGEMEGGMEVGVETIVEAGLGEQIPSEDDAPGGLGSVEPETTEDRSSEVPSPPTDRDTDGLMALEITQFEAAIQQRDEIITQLSANLQQALSSRDGVQQETQHLTTHIQSLQQQLQQASEMLRSTRQWTQTQELAQAQQQLSTCQNLLCEKTSELNRLRSRLELAHATRQPGAEGSLGTRLDGLAQEGAADHEEHTLILQKELQESKTIVSQLEATISQKEAIILTLQQTLPSKDKAPTSTSTSSTGTERAAFCEPTEKVGEAERTVTELQREVSSKDLALEDLRMRLSASAEKEQQLSRENVKLLNDLDNLAKKQGHLDGNLTEVAESNWERREGELKTALGEERDQQVAALRSEMQREVERLQAVIEDLTESNRRSHESLLLLEESNGQLNTSLRDSQAQLASVQEQLSSVLSESTEMDARYGRELENFRVKLEMLENERTEARGRVAELEELNAELSFGREEAQRALEQIREQQEKDTEGLRVALGLEYKGSIDKLTADIENLSVALSQSAEELRSTKEMSERQYIEEMEGLKESLRQEHKENVNKLLADNERLTAELSLGKEVVKSDLGNVPTGENDSLGIQDKCNREVENEKDADVQEYKENLEKLEAELEKLRGDLVHNTQEAQSALEEQRQQHIAEVESLKETLGQQHKGGLDKLLADVQNLTVMLSRHEQEAQSALEKQQQQHLIDKEAQKVTLDQEHKGNIDKLLGDLERLKEELLNNKEEAQCSLEKMKQQHSIEMEGLKETLRQENRVTMDKLQAEVEKLNNERSQSRQEADSRYEQMQQDYSRQVEQLKEQLKEQRMGVQDDACRLEQLLQHHREEVEALKEALRLEHKGAVDKLLNDTETLNAELSLSRQGAWEAQEQLQQQQSRHTEEVQSICEQHIKELETLKETTGQEHAVKVDTLTADIEKLGAELSLRREEELHATVELQEQHARELERLKESLVQEHKLSTDKLLAELEKSHGLTLKDSQEKQKDVDDLAKQLEEKHRLSLELALKGAENQSKVTNEESKAELESKHAEELAALKEDFREKVEKLIQENKSFELEQLETEEGISGILRELEDCATFQETLEISGSTCDNVQASGPALVPSNPSGKAVANPQESPPKPDDDPASQKQGRQLSQLLCALRRQCIAMKGRVQAHVLEKNPREPAAQYQCESEPAPDASPHSVVDGAGTAGAKSSGGGDQTQGQSATTISTAVPSADEFNALLQENAALKERVGDLRKTCDLQQEEMAFLKAQAAGDNEVVEEEKKEVVRKGRGGVAQLNVGSQGDVQTRTVEELDLPGATGPSPQAALSHVPQVEQASGVQVSLLKGWASGSPPHHGIDDKATTAPPPAEQEACEDGVQQQQQQQHHGQTDSESEQKSKTQLEKQEAELQEQAGRVMVQVQVQQKGQKQQQQRKHHRKQQKKHPGMVLVQHMSVVPEEGQEDQCSAQADKDDAKRWDMPSSQAALQVAVDAQRASLEEVHALRLALAMKEEELEALRVFMSTPQGAVELAGESGSHSEEDAAEPSHADSDGRQQTQLSKVAKDKAAATMFKNLPSQQLLLAALEGPMPEPDTDTTGDTVCTKAALSVADSEHPIQGQHLHLESVPPQKDLARGWQKSGPCRGSSPSQGTIPGETRKLSRKETMNKQKPAGRSANVKKEPASQTKPSSRAARATPPMALPCGTCTQLEAERDGLVEGLRMEREACQHLRQRLQVLQQERSRPAIGGDADVAGSVPSRGDRSTGRGDLDVEQRTGSPCELVEGATPCGTDCGDQSEHVETRREEPYGPSLPVIEGSASGVETEMQASTCVKAAEKLSLLSGSRTEDGTADTEMTNGNRDIAGPSEGSGLVACDGGSSSRTAGLSSDSTDLSRRHGLLQCACRRLQLVSTTTRDLLAQISIRVISVVDLTRDEELAQLLRRLKELDAEIAHSEADLTWDSRLASGDPLGRVARQLSELYGRMTVLSEEKEALNAVVLDLTRLLQQRAQTPPPRLTGGPEPAPTWRSDRQLVPPPRRASRGSPATERAMLCVPIGKFQSLHRRFTRAESQRRALLHQKRYLLLVLGSFAGPEQPALALLARPRVELLLIARETAANAANAATQRRFRVVARAVAATCRLRMLLQKQQQQQQQRQRGCTAHGWKVDMPVTAFSTPGRHYRGHSLDEVEREHFWNCSPWSSHSAPCADEHKNPDSFLHDFINKLESIQLRLGPYYTETSSFSRLAKKP